MSFGKFSLSFGKISEFRRNFTTEFCVKWSNKKPVLTNKVVPNLVLLRVINLGLLMGIISMYTKSADIHYKSRLILKVLRLYVHTSSAFYRVVLVPK